MIELASRRQFLQDGLLGLGGMAVGSLTMQPTCRANDVLGQSGFVRRPSHSAPRARAVIHLFMTGAPSHLDLFDYKPKLKEFEGRSIPPEVIGGQRYAFINPNAAALGPQFEFQRHGESGLEIASVLPGLGKIANDVCLIRSMRTDQFNHAPAQIFLNTGFSQPGRPSMGAWVLYGLGAETQNLPAFVVMSTGSGISGGAANWSSGFLPGQYTGVRFRNSGDPILNVSNPPGIDRQLQEASYDLVNRLNRRHLEIKGDPEIATRIASYEMAARLQLSAPELMDIKSETAATLEMYGCEPDKPSFARACLLARRMVERGVRFITIYHEGWDAHSDVLGNHTNNCKTTDQGSAALVTDLKQRGLLDETLVIWGGEFGRTPMVESNPALQRSKGRDHHPQAFSIWMAGAGIRGGMSYGSTDELGFHVAEKPVHVHDLQATILHQLGLDHERLTYRYQGRDFRLTDIHGEVVHEILA